MPPIPENRDSTRIMLNRINRTYQRISNTMTDHITLLVPFEHYTGCIPNTFQADALHIAYELNNLRIMIWYVIADFIYPRFKMNHPIRIKMEHVFNCYILRACLDVFIQWIKAPLHNVFPEWNATQADAELEVERVQQSIFYGGLVHKHLNQLYNPQHQKLRPLPNKLPEESRAYVFMLFSRFHTCLEHIMRFSDTYSTRGPSTNLSAAATKLITYVDSIIESVQ